jgi:hypothetical protein
MSEYNFSNLSPYDFEILTRDLLNASQGLNLRAFAPGRDRGVDLRGWEAGRRNNRVIIQCKHMLGSTYSKILTSVKGEKEKLDKLTPRPTRYILTTTKPLTEGNIEELFQTLNLSLTTPETSS